MRNKKIVMEKHWGSVARRVHYTRRESVKLTKAEIWFAIIMVALGVLLFVIGTIWGYAGLPRVHAYYPSIEELYGDDVVRIEYCKKVLMEEKDGLLRDYSGALERVGIGKYCVLYNAVVRAESGGRKTRIAWDYKNPASLIRCHPRWVKMGIAEQRRVCYFRQYRYNIVAWTRLWISMGYDSSTYRTAKKYTGGDKWLSWYNIVQNYKNKFSYLIN